MPVVAWHSLETSLYKDRTFKQGWNSLLYDRITNATNGGLAGGPAGVQTGGLDPHITSAYNSANATGVLSAADEAWFRDRGPGDKTIRKIKAPTLIVGGTVDTLFPLDEDVKVYRLLKARGTPVKMFWFCGGHGQCAEGNGGEPGAGSTWARSSAAAAAIPPGGGQRGLAGALPEGRPQREDGPGFEFRSDDRKYRVAPAVPGRSGQAGQARGSGTLAIAPGATSGGGTLAAPAASGGLDVPLTVRKAGQLLGPPKVTLTYRGTAPPPTHGSSRS